MHVEASNAQISAIFADIAAMEGTYVLYALDSGGNVSRMTAFTPGQFLNIKPSENLTPTVLAGYVNGTTTQVADVSF